MEKINVITVDPLKLIPLGFLKDPADISLPLTKERINVGDMQIQTFVRKVGNEYLLTQKGIDSFIGETVDEKRLAVSFILKLPSEIRRKIMTDYQSYLSDDQRMSVEELYRRERIEKQKKLMEIFKRSCRNDDSLCVDVTKHKDLIEMALTSPELSMELEKVCIHTHTAAASVIHEIIIEKYPAIGWNPLEDMENWRQNRKNPQEESIDATPSD